MQVRPSSYHRTPINLNLFTVLLKKSFFCGSLYIIITGHAPHDEVPDEVNTILCNWVEQIEVKPALEKTKAI